MWWVVRPLVVPMSDCVVMRMRWSRHQGRFLYSVIKHLFPVPNIPGKLRVKVAYNMHAISSHLILLLLALMKELPCFCFHLLPALNWDSMVDHLEESPLSACASYLPHNLFKRRTRGTKQRGEVYHRDALFFNDTKLWPVLCCLNERWIYLSHALSLFCCCNSMVWNSWRYRICICSAYL